MPAYTMDDAFLSSSDASEFSNDNSSVDRNYDPDEESETSSSIGSFSDYDATLIAEAISDRNFLQCLTIKKRAKIKSSSPLWNHFGILQKDNKESRAQELL